MTLITLLAAAVAASASTCASTCALQDGLRKEWEGYGEGSFVVVRVTRTDGAKQESEVQRYTILKVEPASVTIRLERTGRPPRESPVDLKPDAGFRRTGEESVDIDGRTFTCAVWESTTEKNGTTRTERRWLHKDIPGGVAKLTLTTKSAKSERSGSGRVTRLDQRLVLGGRTIPYCVYEFEGKGDDGREMRQERWISESVPGFTVREDARMRADVGPELRTVHELVDFEVK